MGCTKSDELDRKYRVLRQTLGIHSSLADSLARWAKAIEVVMLGCSAVFCATTFANDKLYRTLGVDAEFGRTILGIASVLAFAASLVLLFVDWKGQSGQHRQAANHWSKVLALFRDAWNSDGTWDAERIEQLNSAYWDADEHSVALPSGARFTKLKSKHLINVAISTQKSRFPGCPRFVLWGIIRIGDTFKALRNAPSVAERLTNNVNADAIEKDEVVS